MRRSHKLQPRLFGIFMFICLLLSSGWLSCIEARSRGDLYQILGVSKDATVVTIKKAYRALSKKFHPDVNDSKDAAERFKDIARAYEVLSDEKKRSAFDQFGMDGVERVESGGSAGGESDIESIFGSFFNFGGGGGRQRAREKNDDTELKLYVTLTQLYRGETFHIAFKRPVLCLHSDECIKHRPDCSGPGISLTTQQLAPNYIVQSQKSDASCVAKNKGWNRNCSKCRNGPLEIEETLLTGIIEPGMRDGNVITFEGAGEQSLSLDPGDLKLTIVQENEDDKYIRDEKDGLHTQIFITLAESLTGFKMNIPHISGTDVEILRTGVTMEGEVIRIPGKGAAKLHLDNEFGDLFVRVRVRYPARPLSAKAQTQIGQIFESETRDWTVLRIPNGVHN